MLDFKGAEEIEIDAQGGLALHAAGGDIRQHKPIIYQEIDGTRREIEGGYIRKGANRIGFQVAAYDTTQPLIIDPVVLSYSTHLGGTNGDGGSAIAVDAGGSAFVTGYTYAANFPTTPDAAQPVFGGTWDAFVTILDRTCSSLLYSTFLGGANGDASTGIAVDTLGNAFVSGETSSVNFPTTPGAFQPTFHGGGDQQSSNGDAFVVKFSQ